MLLTGTVQAFFFSTFFISNSEDEITNYMIKNGAPYKNRSVFFLDFNYKGADVGILTR